MSNPSNRKKLSPLSSPVISAVLVMGVLGLLLGLFYKIGAWTYDPSAGKGDLWCGSGVFTNVLRGLTVTVILALLAVLVYFLFAGLHKCARWVQSKLAEVSIRGFTSEDYDAMTLADLEKLRSRLGDNYNGFVSNAIRDKEAAIRGEEREMSADFW